MPLEVVGRAEALGTGGARVGLLPRVRQLVFLQRAAHAEPLPADAADVRFLSGVDASVRAEGSAKLFPHSAQK